jgi:hypothetical protein
MYTISNIIEDIRRGCARNNLNEDCFTYRIIYYVNENGTGTKHYSDSTYNDLRRTLENIIRGNISLTNNISIAQTTIRKNERCICLQSRSYSFDLSEYFRTICIKKEKYYIDNNYGREKVQWY